MMSETSDESAAATERRCPNPRCQSWGCALHDQTPRPLRLRGQMVRVWHPDSPGVRVLVWRPWWRRKASPFASLSEVLRSYRPMFDATESATSRGSGS